MAALCAEAGVPFVLDASQSAGILPVRMDELHAAFIAMPGHKGLYGPQGTGLLLCNHPVTPLLHGGTGSLSKLQTMPDMLPDRLESGTHNMPGIAGLLEGIRYVQRTGVETIAAHERRLTAQAVELLRYTEGIRLFWCEGFRHQTGVLSFVVEGMDCEELGGSHGAAGRGAAAGCIARRWPPHSGNVETGTVRFSRRPSTHRRRWCSSHRYCRIPFVKCNTLDTEFLLHFPNIFYIILVSIGISKIAPGRGWSKLWIRYWH